MYKEIRFMTCKNIETAQKLMRHAEKIVPYIEEVRGEKSRKGFIGFEDKTDCDVFFQSELSERVKIHE